MEKDTVKRHSRQRKRNLPAHKRRFFKKILSEVAQESRYGECTEHVQHGDTSVWKHCVNVAYTAYCLSHVLHIHVSERELIRGALLHDYFLYDWHENNLKNKIHGLTHPYIALEEAYKDFSLTKREMDVIKKHMFPLTPLPPRCREAVLVCLADKICATKETVRMPRLLSKAQL